MSSNLSYDFSPRSWQEFNTPIISRRVHGDALERLYIKICPIFHKSSTFYDKTETVQLYRALSTHVDITIQNRHWQLREKQTKRAKFLHAVVKMILSNSSARVIVASKRWELCNDELKDIDRERQIQQQLSSLNSSVRKLWGMINGVFSDVKLISFILETWTITITRHKRYWTRDRTTIEKLESY